MIARHRQFCMCIELSVYHHIKMIIPIFHGNIFRSYIGMLRNTKGQNPARNPFDGTHGIDIICIGNDQSIFRGTQTKFMKRMHNIINILEKVQMVGFYIEHNRNRWGKRQKGIAVFAGFCNKTFLPANAQGSPNRRQIASHHNRRVECRLHCNERHHGSACRLSVGAGQTNHVLIIGHETAPSLCTLHNRNTERMGAHDFRVIIMHSRGTDNQRRTLYILRLMAIRNLCSQTFQPLSDRRMCAIRAAYRHSHTQKQLSQ